MPRKTGITPVSATNRFYEELGRNINAARRGKNVTQQQLADAIGISRPSLTNIEKGNQKILIHTVFELAGALGIDVAVLLPARNRPSALDKFDSSQRELITKALSNLSDQTGT